MSKSFQGAYGFEQEIAAANRSSGILGGDAVDKLTQISTELSSEGLVVFMRCPQCAEKAAITVEWHELYVIGTNGPGRPPLFPQGWTYSPAHGGGAVPKDLRCRRCQLDHNHLTPLITPDEARRAVNQGVEQGFVSQQQVATWQHQVASASQGQRR